MAMDGDWGGELGQRFGGFLNVLFLGLVFVVCGRFAGAECKTAPLGSRALYTLYLLLGIAALAIVFAAVGMTFSSRVRRESPWRSDTTAAAVARGLKAGVTVGSLAVFVAGLLWVDGYLGPFQPLIEAAFKKLAGG